MLPIIYTINLILFFYIILILVNQTNYIIMLLTVDVCWIFILTILATNSLLCASVVFIFLTTIVICLSTIELVINLGIVYNNYFKND